MGVHGKCFRSGCPFKFDDGEHMDDVLAKIRAHFRTEHPKKVFWENRYKERLDALNFDLDEAIQNYAGRDWRGRLERQELQPRHITNACANVCRYVDQYQEDVIRGAMALSEEHGVAIPDPFNGEAAAEVAENDFINVPYFEDDDPGGF